MTRLDHGYFTVDADQQRQRGDQNEQPANRRPEENHEVIGNQIGTARIVFEQRAKDEAHQERRRRHVNAHHQATQNAKDEHHADIEHGVMHRIAAEHTEQERHRQQDMARYVGDPGEIANRKFAGPEKDRLIEQYADE